MGDERTVRLLVEKGTDVMIVDRTKWTPLRLAAFNGQQAANGHEDVARVLIEKGADASAVYKNQRTPLKMARGFWVRTLLRDADAKWRA
jgi:ankyrin repeat protein